MSRHKEPYRKKLPAHFYIPDEYGTLSKRGRELYNRVYSCGVRGCWTSNCTLAEWLECCISTAQRTRKELINRKVVIAAWSNNHTMRIWSRFHNGVKKHRYLRYQKNVYLENPCWTIKTSKKANKIPPPDAQIMTLQPWLWGVKSTPQGDFSGVKNTPELYVPPLRGVSRDRPSKETGRNVPITESSQGPAVPEPLARGSMGKDSDSFDPQIPGELLNPERIAYAKRICLGKTRSSCEIYLARCMWTKPEAKEALEKIYGT